MHIDRLGPPLRRCPDGVFCHNQFARLAHGEVGLCSNDQGKRLDLGGRMQRSLAVLLNQFTYVLCISFRAYGPEDIGEICNINLFGRLKVFDVNVDVHQPFLADDLCVSGNFRHQVGALEIHPGRCSATVVDGLGRSGDEITPAVLTPELLLAGA